MPYSEILAGRLRLAIGVRPDVTERKMFGGLAFMTGGKMFCGIVGDELMVRTGPAAYEAALAKPGARLMEFTGRPMTGMVFVGPPGIDNDAGLKQWVDQSYAFASALPAKSVAPKRSRRSRNRQQVPGNN